jgi:hypothetical protein
MVLRPKLALALVLICAFLVAGCLDARSPQYSRWDNEQSKYFKGQFTWNAGKGGLSWAENPTSADPGGPPITADAARGVKAAVGWNLRTNYQNDMGLIPIDTFESDPFPRDIYLNASRFIRLTLYLTGPSGTGSDCSTSSVDVELWLGSTFAGGQLHGVSQGYYPPYAPGYCAESFQIHAEVGKLPVGQRLTVKLLRHSEYVPFQYGMGPGHWSFIELPEFTPDEVLERIIGAGGAVAGSSGPAKGAGANDKGESGAEAAPQKSKSSEATPVVSPADLVLPVGGLALAGLTRRIGGRRGGAVLLALGLLAVGVAGCIQSSDADLSDTSSDQGKKQGKINTTIEQGGGSAAGFGRLHGRVMNDLGLPVQGAHLAVLGTSNSTFSDKSGIFEMKNVPAGAYKLRVDHAKYASLEEPVTIVDGQSTRADILLVPNDDKGKDFRPHQHDNWPSEGRLPLKLPNDGKVRFPLYGAPDTEAPVADCFNVPLIPLFYMSESVQCVAPLRLDLGELILPGTVDIEFNVTWDRNANKVERVGVLAMSNLDIYQYSWITMYPKASGVSTHLRTTWEMTDVGHQKFTTWQFMLYIPTNSGGSIVGNVASVGQTVTQPFKVEVTIHKGIVPYEPEHRDFWGKNTTFEVYKRAPAQLSGCIGCEFPTAGHYWPSYDPFTYADIGNLTPPDTKWLEVLFEAPSAGVPPTTWALAYKPANIPPEADVSQYKKPKELSREGNKVRYQIVLDKEESDAFYALQSNFWWTVDDQREGYTVTYNPTTPGQSMYLTVTAHRTGSPTG